MDEQDPSNVGWCWRRAFEDGHASTGEDETFDAADELLALCEAAGYLGK